VDGVEGGHLVVISIAADLPVRARFNWWEAWGEIKIEGFGGRPNTK